MIEIVRLPQLGASIAEPLAVSLTAELMARDMMRTQSHAWDDRATVAVAGGVVAGLISWKVLGWQAQAFITLGGVAPDYRRCGIYRRLFADLVDDVAANHPAATCIASGHHINNRESEAMHLALGRTLETLGYVFPVVRPRP